MFAEHGRPYGLRPPIHSVMTELIKQYVGCDLVRLANMERLQMLE